MDPQQVRAEQFKVTGEKLVAKLKQLLHEGNIRQITIKDDQGKTVFDFPLTLGVVGAMLAPQLAVIAALVALAREYTILVERTDR
jgi:hypothetical protein